MPPDGGGRNGGRGELGQDRLERVEARCQRTAVVVERVLERPDQRPPFGGGQLQRFTFVRLGYVPHCTGISSTYSGDVQSFLRHAGLAKALVKGRFS